MIQQGRSMRTLGSMGTAVVAALALVLPLSVKMTQAQQTASPPTRGIIPASTRPAATRPTQGELERRVRAQLNRLLPALQFDAVGFADVIDFLRDVSGSNIQVNWSALAVAGVDRETPISAHLRNVPFANALDVILGSAGDGRARLTYTIQGGTIIISAADVTNVLLATYDVRPILAGKPDYGPKLLAQIVNTVDPPSGQYQGGNMGFIKLEDV